MEKAKELAREIQDQSEATTDVYNVFAVVNYNAVDTWLEPYIGSALKIIKKGVKVTWFEMNYGKKVKRKIDSNCFN